MPMPITFFARSASARTDGSAAASSPEIRSATPARHRRPRRRRPRSRRRRRRGRWGQRQVEGGGRVEVAREPGGVVGVVGDQHGALDASSSGSARQHARAGRRAALIQRSTIGARSATGSSQSTTTDGRVADRRERRPEAVEPVGDVLEQHRRMRPEPDAEQLREPVGLLHRLGAGERGHDRRAGRRSMPLDPRRARRPTERLEPPRACPAQRSPRSGRRRADGRREPALVAERALVDLRVVAREDPLDLALACRGADVAVFRTMPPTCVTTNTWRSASPLPAGQWKALVRISSKTEWRAPACAGLPQWPKPSSN